MEKTIDEIIDDFGYIKRVGNGEFSYRHCREEIALDEAVIILRKYQKIEQIIEVWRQDIYAKDFECIAEVAEVVEDGNVD